MSALAEVQSVAALLRPALKGMAPADVVSAVGATTGRLQRVSYDEAADQLSATIVASQTEIRLDRVTGRQS